MRKRVLRSSLIPMVGVLLLTVIAGSHSLAVAKTYDERMRADIQRCAQQLTQAGLSGDQIQALQSVLNEINHNTESYVSSAVDTVIGAVGFMGVVIMSAFLGWSARTTDQPEPRQATNPNSVGEKSR